MWLGTAALVAEHANKRTRKQKHADALLDELLRREEQLRAFATDAGASSISDIVDPNVMFIDTRGAVHRLDDEFKSTYIMDFDSSAYALQSLEFFGHGSITISIARLESTPASPSGRKDRILWTVTWRLTDDQWQVVLSQASRPI